MLYRKWFTVLSLFVIAALILSACRPIAASSTAPLAQNGAVPIPDMPRSDAPPYGLRGPHAVGVRDFVIESAQEGERPINVTVWYPASNPDGRTEAETYMLNFNNPDYPDFAIAGRALRDAEVLSMKPRLLEPSRQLLNLCWSRAKVRSASSPPPCGCLS